MRGHKLLDGYVALVTQKFGTIEPDQAYLERLREALRRAIDTAFNTGRQRLSPLGVAWLADWYFKRVRLPDDRVVADAVVINEYAVHELPEDDRRALNAVYKRTPVGDLLATSGPDGKDNE